MVPAYGFDTATWSYSTWTTNTAGYWSHYQRQVASAYTVGVESVRARARRNLAWCREVSVVVPARLRPQTVGMSLEYFVARSRGGSSGRPGYRRRRRGGRVA